MRDDDRPLIRTDIPHSARIWNYWMGGKDYYEIDQIAGDVAAGIYPDILATAVHSRKFLIRVVHHLAAEAGIRQFLDIGTGLPTGRNTHEVAQAVAPESKIVYVDNDPLVLAHARALAHGGPAGAITFADTDFHAPEQIIADARSTLDFNQPVGILLLGVLGHANTYDDALRVVHTVLDAVPSGSYLALWDGTTDSETYVMMCDRYAETGGVPYIPRDRAEIRAAFDGLELVEPGFVPIDEWRTESARVDAIRPLAAFGAVARKP
ncbi:SAM-dependent methyltransferase [Nocardia arthritidis]|uniref:SAM-dependent methyltransferase n=1 Tax=Nocardia arthritidis TaxID=228602 RepID=A0A6G9YFV0_9NOCA|nr:SAM-dependent methyltransferase [Nocardia arthritidis]QIS12082.1 SAM-dependent methyltransferase [Nocardia arthritidis]